jgi:hypothetical protein
MVASGGAARRLCMRGRRALSPCHSCEASKASAARIHRVAYGHRESARLARCRRHHASMVTGDDAVRRLCMRGRAGARPAGFSAALHSAKNDGGCRARMTGKERDAAEWFQSDGLARHFSAVSTANGASRNRARGACDTRLRARSRPQKVLTGGGAARCLRMRSWAAPNSLDSRADAQE